MAHNSEQSDNHVIEEGLIPSSQWGECKAVSAEELSVRLSNIKSEIAPCKPRIIGVTKYYGIESVINGYKAGLRDFGESRTADAVNKILALPKEIREQSKFHFIGHLQTNKVKKTVQYFDFIHSVDSLKLAKAISDAANEEGKKMKILLQVNNAHELQKSGYDSYLLKLDLPEILNCDGIEVIGLMNMTPVNADRGELLRLFGNLRELRDSLEKEFCIKLPELSMGMSNDYMYAVSEGATMIRIGRKLFS